MVCIRRGHGLPGVVQGLPGVVVGQQLHQGMAHVPGPINLPRACRAQVDKIVKVAQLKQAHYGLECILVGDGRVRLQLLQRGGALTGGS